MKKKNVVILPSDGYPTGQACLKAVKELLYALHMQELLAYIKVNDAVHNDDYGGPALVHKIVEELEMAQCSEVKIFLDLKLADVSATVINTLKKYRPKEVGILTISSRCNVETMVKLRELLPNTKLAMVSMLTDISEQECLERTGMSPGIAIFNDLQNIRRIYQKRVKELENWAHPEPFDLIVCSPHELTFLKRNLPADYGFIVPGIRDEWMKSEKDHQKRTTGVREALEMGATYVVMGAQMTKGNPEKGISAEESRTLTYAEIAKVKDNPVVYGDPLTTLKNCGGYYCSPKDQEGKYRGPLVAYAGTYEDQGPKNKVGFEYFNFAKAEAKPKALAYFAKLLAEKIKESEIQPDVLLGAPMGGIFLAGALGQSLNCSNIFAEKKVIALANPEEKVKEQSAQVIDRHEIDLGNQVVIVEDVCNNFSTTEKLKALIESKGGNLLAIVCAFNRSGKSEWNGIPVISALDIPTQQFRQDDPEVFDLATAGNIVWNPKDEWCVLADAMNR